MSAETDEIRDIAAKVERAAVIFDWIAGNENADDKARTLADNEVLHRSAKKLSDAADFFDGAVENPDA